MHVYKVFFLNQGDLIVFEEKYQERPFDVCILDGMLEMSRRVSFGKSPAKKLWKGVFEPPKGRKTKNHVLKRKT